MISSRVFFWRLVRNISFRRSPVRSFSTGFTSKSFRDLTCGEVMNVEIGKKVKLVGWIGGLREVSDSLTFVVLRDSYGVVQVVLEKVLVDVPSAIGSQISARSLKLEGVLQVEGVVRSRPVDMINPDMLTGTIEIVCEKATLLSSPECPLAFHPGIGAAQTSMHLSEEVRMQNRVLDLRRDQMQRNLRLRSLLLNSVRQTLLVRNYPSFVEVETPTLFRSSPEGAREFLVPTRSKGCFYALTQSPQQFKQMLMIGGVDRYFQIARCFRDEQGRADRQPEFTQLDMELSFAKSDDVMSVVESVVTGALSDLSSASQQSRNLKKLKSVTIQPPLSSSSLIPSYPFSNYNIPLDEWNAPQAPFERVTFAHALLRFGSDKPDRRLGMPIRNVTSFLVNHDCKQGPETALSQYTPLRPLLSQAHSIFNAAGSRGDILNTANMLNFHKVDVDKDDDSLHLLGASSLSAHAFVVPGLASKLSSKLLDILLDDMYRAAGLINPFSKVPPNSGSSEGPDKMAALLERYKSVADSIELKKNLGACSFTQNLDLSSFQSEQGAKGGQEFVVGQSHRLSPFISLLSVGPNSTLKGSQLAKLLNASSSIPDDFATFVGAKEGDLIVLGLGGGLELLNALGFARLVAAEVSRAQGLTVAPTASCGTQARIQLNEPLPVSNLVSRIFYPSSTQSNNWKGLKSKTSGGKVDYSSSDNDRPALDLFWVHSFPLFELTDAATVENIGKEESYDCRKYADEYSPSSTEVNADKVDELYPPSLISSSHHPFTAPTAESYPLLLNLVQKIEVQRKARDLTPSMTAFPVLKLDSDTLDTLLALKGDHYDLICNGFEIGGGSVRIHNYDIQMNVMSEILRVPPKGREGFATILGALQLGAPPHAGFALGIDRFVSILSGAHSSYSIRDVLAFPKTTNGKDLLSGAPSSVSQRQLDEYSIEVSQLK